MIVENADANTTTFNDYVNARVAAGDENSKVLSEARDFLKEKAIIA